MFGGGDGKWRQDGHTGGAKSRHFCPKQKPKGQEPWIKQQWTQRTRHGNWKGKMSHLTRTTRRNGTADASAAAGTVLAASKANERVVQRLVNEVLRNKLPGMVKDAIEQAINEHRKDAEEANTGSREQMEALQRKVEELERSKENSPPGVDQAENAKKRGLYETMEEMRNHQHGEIKMKIGR